MSSSPSRSERPDNGSWLCQLLSEMGTSLHIPEPCAAFCRACFEDLGPEAELAHSVERKNAAQAGADNEHIIVEIGIGVLEQLRLGGLWHDAGAAHDAAEYVLVM